MVGPVVDSSLMPAEVRTGTAKDRALYATALQFEQVLERRLAQLVTPETDDSGDADDSGGATDAYQQMLPDALANALTGAGGLGLAPALYHSLKQAS
jgi:Rod binding domain-containing protein